MRLRKGASDAVGPRGCCCEERVWRWPSAVESGQDVITFRQDQFRGDGPNSGAAIFTKTGARVFTFMSSQDIAVGNVFIKAMDPETIFATRVESQPVPTPTGVGNAPLPSALGSNDITPRMDLNMGTALEQDQMTGRTSGDSAASGDSARAVHAP